MPVILGLTAAFVVLLFIAAALTATLSAVLKVTDSKARILVGEGFAGADALTALRTGEAATSPLVILRAICNLAAAAAGVGAAAAAWGPRGMWIGGPVVIIVVLLAGELGPRALAARRPVRLALAAAPFLRASSRLFGRVFFPVFALGRVFYRGSGADDGSPDEMQAREALEIGAGAGIVDPDENRLIERAFKLDELNAWDAMTPRVDIVAWQDSRRLGDVLPELAVVPHSRVPVYNESIDDVTGILHVRDAYRAYVAGQRDVPLSELAREAMFVPGSLSLARLLADFRARRMHMGIVADEFGGTDGLITLEDVLEELVGEIVDETDLDEDPLTRVSPDEILASGGAEIREINDRFAFDLPEGENRSLNGFILEELGQVPEPGRALTAGGVHIEVLEASETQVLRARLRREAAPRGDGPAR